ncbi:Arc family DNA binding domain-containing protein [Pedobacter sp. SYP-B3415]|uniref:Arc family DNA binding domain-containing protein n=1 Tax=Pedobacter sp. SYP-B3415 TaxID=2496641 RepID=UPI00101B61E1|nr:Arc family DNA binding domain-containing protein [Pedobacter sp. SYP-B3415]
MPDKEKKAFVLRVSPAMMQELEQWAAEEFRSTNGQIEYLLSQAIKNRRKRRGGDKPD